MNCSRRQFLARGASGAATFAVAGAAAPLLASGPQHAASAGQGDASSDAAIGSIEYAVQHLGTPLVLVLGHSSCGAVAAANDVVVRHAKLAGHLAGTVEPILPRSPPHRSDAALQAFFPRPNGRSETSRSA